MSNETEALLLKAVLEQYATPDPKIVGQITKGGVSLDFVGHAEITRILIEIDPNWNWSPIAWENGRPAIHEANGVATMWGTLTLLGKSLIGVGSAQTMITTMKGEKYPKPDYEKELIGDFLRNASMRFGICLALWSRQDWHTTQVQQSKTTHPASVQRTETPMPSEDGLSDDEIASAFTTAKPAVKIGALISDKQKGLVTSLAKEVADGDTSEIIKQLFNKANLNTLTTKEGSALITHLMGMRSKVSDEQPF